MLSRPRDTMMRQNDILAEGVAANARCHQGGIAVADANGFIRPGATAANHTALGRFEESVDNTGGANGAVKVTVRRGVFLFANLGADPVTQAMLGKDCWIHDDETVAGSNGGGTRSRAGKVHGLEGSGVWVEFA